MTDGEVPAKYDVAAVEGVILQEYRRSAVLERGRAVHSPRNSEIVEPTPAARESRS